MTRTRASASLAIATALAGVSVLSGTLATPIAHADDPLAPIRSAVNGARGGTPCPALKYNLALENAAQAYARSENQADGFPAGDWAAVAGFLGSGDPQSQAIDSVMSRGAARDIGDCGETAFGVGFIRHEDRSVDVVTIVLGQPAAPKPANTPAFTTPAAVPPPASPPPVVAPPENKPLQGPTVSATPGVAGVTFHVTDRSGVASQCTYSSEGFTSDSFALPANGSFDLFVPAIREFRNRTGTVTCDNGTSAGTSVNF